jgi:type II secretory pathway component PulM
MSTVNTRIRSILDRAQDVLADMTPRDRTLLLGLSGLALLVALGGSVWWMSSTVSSLQARIDDREDTLAAVQLAGAQYEAAAVEASAIETQLKKYAGTDLSSYLEKAATTANVKDKLKSVREKSSAVDGNIEEKLHTVSLDGMSLAELTEFLYEVETSGYPLRIKTFRVKTRSRRGETTLNVDMDISAFQILDDTSTSEAG